MKILHFVHNYYGFSGASRQAKNIALGIKNNPTLDVDQRFFTLGHGDDTENEFKIYGSSTGIFKRCFKFVLVLLKYQPDVLHMHGADFALLIVAKLLGSKVYWKTTLCGSDDFDSLVRGRFGFFKKKIIKHIDTNNTLTKQISSINEKYLDESRLITIPNGVDIPISCIENKEKIAVIISAIIPRKGIINGINFFNENLRSDGYKLYIIGPSNRDIDGFDFDYYLEFEKLVDNDIIYIGKQNFSTISSYLTKAKFLIHFSEFEGMPNIVLEAMAYSCFPITLSMGGLYKELYENGVSGVNVEDYNFDAKDYNNCNVEGYELMCQRNSFQIVSEKTCAVYFNLYK